MRTLPMTRPEARRQSRWGDIILTAALILFGLLTALACGEIGFRCVALLQKGSDQSPALRRSWFDDRSFRRSAWSLIPHGKSDAYVGVPVFINNLGMRGADTTIEKPRGVFRIIGVGDSITFGYGVRYEDTFLQVLERKLNASAPKGLRYEVLNAGIPATGLEYYTHFIEAKAPSLDPDLIVMSMALNDIDPELNPEPRELVAKPSVFRAMNGFALTHSDLYSAVYVQTKSLLYKLDVLSLEDNDGFGFLAIEPPSAAQAKAREAVSHYLKRISDFTRARHIAFRVVVFPVEPQLSKEALQLYARQLHLYFGDDVINGQPQQWIRQFGANDGFPVLDLLPAMQRADHGQLFLRNRSITFDPVHPSPIGHELAGEEITRFLSATVAVPAPRVGESRQDGKSGL